ncbi:hypothetical protein SAMN06265348_10386 [Pedobacter westerhofensis]|uniref:N-acetylmuramoyl-L-alanine amidase n=1 Tax=Pedobacter westerhofensis TaxID=425512 RepID=A0A521BZ01_9SPHI|nr:hypothetical protein [Pedobacter westerhofensis]SMO52407.1 hypothetical protein SAMN06265348_10386 [Pedobacter westerhofensis]
MLLRSLALLFLCCFALNLKAQHPPVFEGMTSDSAYVTLGDLDVGLINYKYSDQNIHFLAIHDDEDTGVKAAFRYINDNGGTLLDCQYGGVRNYKFIYEDEEYQTDPNSIYTKKGIKAGLQKYGIWDDNVILELEKAGKAILNTYNPKKAGYIFTLHNNADGGFGVSSYLKGYELEGTADSVHINFEMDNDDMLLVTELAVFNLLKKENVNVVLQSKDAVDDGSLSIYAMQNNIPYINAEVQHGHIDEHLRLIKIGARVLAQVYPATGIKEPIPE